MKWVVEKVGRRLGRKVSQTVVGDSPAYVAPSITTDKELRREVRGALRGEEPIIVGPWLSEVGFELLYWIPFLHWLVDAFDVDPKRLVVLSRGGVSSWYQHLTPRYYDLFEFLSETEFRDVNEARQRRQDNSVKQVYVDGFDRQLVGRVNERLGISRSRMLHPYLMYRALIPYWSGERGFAFAKSILKF